MQTKLRARPGFSIVEMLIAMTVSTVAVAAFFGTITNMYQQHRNQRDWLMAEDALRNAEHVLRSVLQTAGADPLSTGLALLHPDPLGHGTFDNVRVKSDFNPADGDFNDELEDVVVKVVSDTLLVQWQVGGGFSPLAYPVQAVTFEYIDNVGTPLTTVAATAGAIATRFTITVPESPISTSMRSRRTWVFLMNRQ